MKVAYKAGEKTANLYSIITDINCSMHIKSFVFLFFFLEIATTTISSF